MVVTVVLVVVMDMMMVMLVMRLMILMMALLVVLMMIMIKCFGPIWRNPLNSDKLHRNETTTSHVVGSSHEVREISTAEKLYWDNSLGLKTTRLNLAQHSIKAH